MMNLVVLLKYMQGKHDQRSHGRRKSSAAANSNKNVAESVRLGNKYGAQPKQCWHNSVTLLSAIPGAVYVEGYFAAQISPDLTFPLEHGWLEKDGQILDVTLPEDSGNYYAAQRYTLKDIETKLSGGKELTLPITSHRDSAMREAQRLATKDAFWLV